PHSHPTLFPYTTRFRSGLGLVLREHAFLHHHAPRHFAAGVHVADQLRQLLAEQRVAFHGGIELARAHRLERAAHAVDGHDADVGAGLEAGLLDRLDRADRHVVVVREPHVDVAALRLEEGFHHFLAPGAGDIAALRTHDLDAVVALGDFRQTAHAV